MYLKCLSVNHKLIWLSLKSHRSSNNDKKKLKCTHLIVL